jgi:hypothetical protein
MGAAAVLTSNGWVIDPVLADQQWADATDPQERGSGHHRQSQASSPRTAKAAPRERVAPIAASNQAALPRGVPARAVSEATLAAIKVQRETMAFLKEEGKLAYIEDMEVAYNAVLLQLTTKAASVHKQIKAAIPHLTHRELEKIERIIADIFESVASHGFEELPE